MQLYASIYPIIIQLQTEVFMINEEPTRIILKGNSKLKQRIDYLYKLFDNAERRVLHCDTFRQRNINYALLIFAGLFVLGENSKELIIHILISFSLLLLMISFTLWDRKWHKTKHGWQYTRNMFRDKLALLINNEKDNIEIFSYYKVGEDDAERDSFQPLLFYFLIIGSIGSFFIFRIINKVV